MYYPPLIAPALLYSSLLLLLLASISLLLLSLLDISSFSILTCPTRHPPLRCQCSEFIFCFCLFCFWFFFVFFFLFVYVATAAEPLLTIVQHKMHRNCYILVIDWVCCCSSCYLPFLYAPFFCIFFLNFFCIFCLLLWVLLLFCILFIFVVIMRCKYVCVNVSCTVCRRERTA